MTTFILLCGINEQEIYNNGYLQTKIKTEESRETTVQSNKQ